MRRNSSFLSGTLLPIGIGLVALLGLTLFQFNRTDVEGTASATPAAPATTHPPAGHTRQFFGWPSRMRWLPLTNSSNPFFTLAIQPPPPPKPPPPPPTTKKVDIVYRGFYETSAGVRRAVVQVADKEVLARKGDIIVADFVTTDIELKFLAVTNPAGKSVKFNFATNQPIEVPAK